MLRESELLGSAYLADVTTLLQRVRQEHPTAGPLEAADYQWWWRMPRRSDEQPKAFWYDDKGPVAAAVTTDWGSATWLDVIVVSSLRADLLPLVFERGLGLPLAGGSSLELLVDDDDGALTGLLRVRGFKPEPFDATGWMDAVSAPKVTVLADGYSLQSRAENASVNHPFELMPPEVELRLSQTSLYRPDLDLTIIDGDGDGAGAAHALFWFDPATSVGLVEPVGTAERHRGKGLARHLVTEGIRRLVETGSKRIKVSWELDNEPAIALYTGAGFSPLSTGSIWAATET